MGQGRYNQAAVDALLAEVEAERAQRLQEFNRGRAVMRDGGEIVWLPHRRRVEGRVLGYLRPGRAMWVLCSREGLKVASSARAPSARWMRRA